MTDQVTDEQHAGRINIARRQLIDARSAFAHSPNAENEAWAKRAEEYLNEKLEARPRLRDRV